MDIQQGFLQIHVDGTAFRTKFGSYQFKVLPFGLCNAPATFQRLLTWIDRCSSFYPNYLDDLIFHSKTTQEHLLWLRQVFSIMRAERFYAKSLCIPILPFWVRICRFLLSVTMASTLYRVSLRLFVRVLPLLPPMISVPFWEFVVFTNASFKTSPRWWPT